MPPSLFVRRGVCEMKVRQATILRNFLKSVADHGLDENVMRFLSAYTKAFQPTEEHMKEMSKEFREYLRRVIDKERWPAKDVPEQDEVRKRVELIEALVSAMEGDQGGIGKAPSYMATIAKLHYLLFITTKYCVSISQSFVPDMMRDGMVGFMFEAFMRGMVASEKSVKELDDLRKEKSSNIDAATEMTERADADQH